MSKVKGYEYYKNFSFYLNPKNRNQINGGIMEGNPADIQHHLNRIVGFDNGKIQRKKNEYILAKLPALKKELETFDREFEREQKRALQMGGEPVEVMSSELQEKKAEVVAQIQVCEDEVKWLKEKLEEAKSINEIVDRKPILPRQQWAQSQLKDDVMIHVGGHETKINEDGILYISDNRSPYRGMLVHQFRSKIVNPMFAEFRYRQRMELKESKEKRRDRKPVRFPQPPKWDKKKGTVEFPSNYSKTVIKKYK